VQTDDNTRAFTALNPDQILDAVENSDFVCDGRILALNSYENRVYQIGIEDQSPLIAKFYRPQRWTDESILEEHAFSQELADLEIPVIAPLPAANGNTLRYHDHFRFALYVRQTGRPPELDNPDHLLQMGRFVGRMHAVASTRDFQHRPVLSTQAFGIDASRYVLDSGLLPMELETVYDTLTQDLVTEIQSCEARAGEVQTIRLHGDFHPGNILWAEDGPHVVDLDDARTGPAIQDLWMFLSGDRSDMTAGIDELLEGYTGFHHFDARELNLIEALRTLRMIHYAAWLARRWEDPAFPLAFPWFNTRRFWDDHILELREQAALLSEPPLMWMGG
jgi:Ser/Thr protein kinase RdoA (MazF antagonist)